MQTTNTPKKKNKKEIGPNVLQKKAQQASIKKAQSAKLCVTHLCPNELQKKTQWAYIKKAQSTKLCVTHFNSLFTSLSFSSGG